MASNVWAAVALIMILVANYRYGQWQAKQSSLANQEYETFKQRLDDLQNQISKISIQRGFNDE